MKISVHKGPQHNRTTMNASLQSAEKVLCQFSTLGALSQLIQELYFGLFLAAM